MNDLIDVSYDVNMIFRFENNIQFYNHSRNRFAYTCLTMKRILYR